MKRASGAQKPAAAAPPSAPPPSPKPAAPAPPTTPAPTTPAPKRPSGKRPRASGGFGWRAGIRWFLWLVVGVAAMAGAGYLVAALVLFPSPLLPNERQVTRVIGLSEDQARRELTQAGLAVEISGAEPHPTEPAGTVFWQDPAAGTAIPRGAIVTLTMSAGPPRVMVPDVSGLDLDLATRLLKAAGLLVGSVDSLDEKTIMSGVAVATVPAAGDSLLMGRSVTIHLAR